MNSPLRKENEQHSNDREPNTRASETQPESNSAAQAGGPQLIRSETRPEETKSNVAKAPDNAELPNGPRAEDTAQEPSLFPSDDLQQLQFRWDQIQTGFVDQPRAAVHDAEQLVASAMQKLSDIFADERSRLERQWSNGSVSTEDLRLALQRYRVFFRRVLSI
jgi:hypothetical protein